MAASREHLQVSGEPTACAHPVGMPGAAGRNITRMLGGHQRAAVPTLCMCAAEVFTAEASV